MSRYDVEGGLLEPQFRTETDLPDMCRHFGHNMRKHGYRATVPHRFLEAQRSELKKSGMPFHEFPLTSKDWLDVETALIQATHLGKMKPWHILAYKHENVVGGSRDYPRLELRCLGMLVFTREADWLMFKMCL